VFHSNPLGVIVADYRAIHFAPHFYHQLNIVAACGVF
jgi:hypothetical protein